MTASAVPDRQSSPVHEYDVRVPVPIALVLDSRLTAGAVRCWAWLASRPLGPDDRPPSRRDIAEALDVSMTGATKWLVALERTGWISRELRWAQPWALSVNWVPVNR